MAVRIVGVCRKLINANLTQSVLCNRNALRKICLSSVFNGMHCIAMLYSVCPLAGFCHYVDVNGMYDRRGVCRTFFYEILVAASVECSSHIVEVASCYVISRARNFFAAFC